MSSSRLSPNLPISLPLVLSTFHKHREHTHSTTAIPLTFSHKEAWICFRLLPGLYRATSPCLPIYPPFFSTQLPQSWLYWLWLSSFLRLDLLSYSLTPASCNQSERSQIRAKGWTSSIKTKLLVSLFNLPRAASGRGGVETGHERHFWMDINRIFQLYGFVCLIMGRISSKYREIEVLGRGGSTRSNLSPIFPKSRQFSNLSSSFSLPNRYFKVYDVTRSGLLRGRKTMLKWVADWLVLHLAKKVVCYQSVALEKIWLLLLFLHFLFPQRLCAAQLREIRKSNPEKELVWVDIGGGTGKFSQKSKLSFS